MAKRVILYEGDREFHHNEIVRIAASTGCDVRTVRKYLCNGEGVTKSTAERIDNALAPKGDADPILRLVAELRLLRLAVERMAR